MPDQDLLKDLHVIITGGATGMGREMTLAVLRRGGLVTVVDKSERTIAELREDLRRTPWSARAHLVAADVSLPDRCSAAVRKAQEKLGPAYALVNNAGVGRGIVKDDIFKSPPKLWDMTPATWQAFVGVNASAVFYMMLAVLPDMLARRRGRIVNVTTSLDSMLNGGGVGYGPSKAAAESLSSIAAHDLEGTGVEVNVLVPGGAVNTTMIPVNAPVDRMSLLPADCMNEPLVWLLSDEATGYSGYRVRAHLWDSALPGLAAFRAASSPVAWRPLAGEIRRIKTS